MSGPVLTVIVLVLFGVMVLAAIAWERDEWNDLLDDAGAPDRETPPYE